MMQNTINQNHPPRGWFCVDKVGLMIYNDTNILSEDIMNRFVENIRRDNPEIFLYIQKKKRNKILIIAVLELIILALGTGGMVSFKKLDSGSILIMIFLALIVPFLIKPHKLVFDKMWQGKIDKIEHRSGLVDNDSHGNKVSMKKCDYIILYIVDEEDKEHKIQLLKMYEKCYSVGDRVVHLPGIDYPANIDSNNNEQRVCVCCGTMMLLGDECVECGRPFFES